MNKTQYDILKFIQTSYDDGIVGTQKIKDAFQQVGDAYHYLRWLNRNGYTEETIRMVNGRKKHFYFVTKLGRSEIERFEASEVVSDDPIENVIHVARKYGEVTTQFIADKLMLSYNGASKIAIDSVKSGKVLKRKEGRQIYYKIVDSVE